MIVLLAVGIAGFRWISGFKTPPERREGESPLVPVSVAPARLEDHVERYRCYGKVKPLRSAALSAELASVVTEISRHLEAGQRVAEGDVLVRLDDRSFAALRARAAARHELARAERARDQAALTGLELQRRFTADELRVSRAELQRMEGLVAQGTSAQADLDQQRRFTTGLERALARLDQEYETAADTIAVRDQAIAAAQADLDLADLDLQRCQIRAPFSGVVVSRAVNLGERTAPGQELLRLVDLDRVEIPLAVPGRALGEVVVGATARLEMAGRTETMELPVARIAPAIDDQTRSFFAYVVLAREDGLVPPAPGDFVEGSIEGRIHRDVIVVPRTATLGDLVFLARPQDDPAVAIVEARRIHPVRVLPEVVLLDSGIAPGELVILDNLEEVADGGRVRLIRPGKDGAGH